MQKKKQEKQANFKMKMRGEVKRKNEKKTI